MSFKLCIRIPYRMISFKRIMQTRYIKLKIIEKKNNYTENAGWSLNEHQRISFIYLGNV